MKKQNLLQYVVVSVLGVMIVNSDVSATSSDRDMRAKRGTVACSGNFNASTGHRSRWIIHNLNERDSIVLRRMRTYTATGTLVYDSTIHGPAPSATGVPFGSIGPMQTVMFKSEDLIAANLLPGDLPGSERPVKTIIDWSSTARRYVVTPYVLLSRPGPGDQRHARDCRTID